MIRPPAFVDCHGDSAERLTQAMTDRVPGVEVIAGPADDPGELIARMQGRRHVLAYMAYMSADVLRACPDLRTIAYLSTGLATHGDQEEAARLGIRFEGVKGYGDRAVAEHAIALAFAGLRRLAQMDRRARDGRWGLMRSEEFAGKTFGLIGLGGIGVETARLAHALGARCIGWTRSGGTGDAPVEAMPAERVLAEADILSLHLALTPETAGWLDADRIAATKPGAILVNTARGGLVDETALLAALEAGQLSHAALDVVATEPLPAGHPLAARDDVTLTPHSAWLTTAATDRLLVAGFDLLARHVADG